MAQDVPVSKTKFTVKKPVLVLLYPHPLSILENVHLTFRTVREDGEGVRVNAVQLVGRGLVSVINGHESAMWIYVGVVMQQRFWIQ